jgi:hypothetical protein
VQDREFELNEKKAQTLLSQLANSQTESDEKAENASVENPTQ